MTDTRESPTLPPPALTPPAPVPPRRAVPAPDAPAPTRGFTAVLIGTATLVLAAGLAVNFLGNDTGMFPSPIHPSASDRAWKTRRLDDAARAGRPPRALILGSSRVMQVQPAYVEALTGKTTFNYGVSAAGPEDFITQLRYALSIGCKPDLLIVGVDETACANLGSRYALQTASHWGLFQSMPVPERLRTAAAVLAGVTPATTLNSLQALARGPRPRNRKARQVTNILLDDGYLIYRDKFAARRAGTYDLSREVRKTAQRWNAGLAREPDPDRALPLDARKMQLFDEFLTLAHDNRIPVRVMLLPLHPEYERLVMTPAMTALRDGLRHRLDASCRHRGAVFRDFTSLAAYGGDPNEFWDGAHQTPENLRRMSNALFDLPPGHVAARVPGDAQLLEHLPPVTTLNTW